MNNSYVEGTDGKPRIVRTATLRVEKGGTFPVTYAAAGDERSETGTVS